MTGLEFWVHPGPGGPYETRHEAAGAKAIWDRENTLLRLSPGKPTPLKTKIVSVEASDKKED